MIKRDFMSARNSGTSPFKLLFDKSLAFDEYKISITVEKPKHCEYYSFMFDTYSSCRLVRF